MTMTMAAPATMVDSDLKCQIDKDAFADAVAWATRGLPIRPTHPILAGVLITGTDGTVTVSTFDYDTARQTRVPAEISTDGQALVSGRLLAEITKALPAKPATIAVDAGRMVLTCGSAKFTLPLMEANDYPVLPVAPEQTGEVPADLFAAAVAQVTVAAGRDEALPMLTGARVEISGETITLAATDRFRLAVRELTWSTNSPGAETAVLVPAKVLAEAANSVTPGSEVRLALGSADQIGQSKLLGFSTGDRHSTTRLLDAQFPKFRQLFPAQYTAVAVVAVAELSEAIKRVALVADRGAPIHLDFTNTGDLRVSAGSTDGAELAAAEEDLAVQFAGEPLRIAFNAGYLTDGLAALHSEHVSFGFTAAQRPAVLTPAEKTTSITDLGEGPFPAAAAEYRYLLMPVRLPG